MTLSDESQIAAEITKFISEALAEWQSGDKFLYSRHLDEILPELPASTAEQTRLAFRLFGALIEHYQMHSQDLMAMLVVELADSVTLERHALDELVNSDLSLASPPELCLSKRTRNDEPYAVEEYKLPISQDVVRANSGIVYAYFRAFKNHKTDEAYGQGFYFEHYPKGDLGYDRN